MYPALFCNFFQKFYTLNFRVVRFAITEDSYECIITNLPKKEFPADEIKKIYAMRWGIEICNWVKLYDSDLYMLVFPMEWYFFTWCWKANTEKSFACQTWALRPSQSQTQVSDKFSVSSSLASTKVYRFFRQIATCLFVLLKNRPTYTQKTKIGRDRAFPISAWKNVTTTMS